MDGRSHDDGTGDPEGVAGDSRRSKGRAFTSARLRQPGGSRLDPFLLLDDFRSDDPSKFLRGFPWHPHRGIETITYVLEGNVEHGDSMGNQGSISAGDVQWMTAGSGIVHQEMPKGDARGRMGGFQLWANLPPPAR
jgi:redox-sensitive bicupin YhaK (pirin superfamily)